MIAKSQAFFSWSCQNNSPQTGWFKQVIVLWFCELDGQVPHPRTSRKRWQKWLWGSLHLTWWLVCRLSVVFLGLQKQWPQSPPSSSHGVLPVCLSLCPNLCQAVRVWYFLTTTIATSVGYMIISIYPSGSCIKGPVLILLVSLVWFNNLNTCAHKP